MGGVGSGTRLASASAHGFATLGTIGYEGRFDYAAMGDGVECGLSPLR